MRSVWRLQPEADEEVGPRQRRRRCGRRPAGHPPHHQLNAGISKVESKVRGDAAVPAAMIKWVESRVDSMKDTPYMVAYTSSTARRDELVKLCKKAFGHAPLIVFQLGGVVSANTGPDGIAIVYEASPAISRLMRRSCRNIFGSIGKALHFA